jgi:hypothetical protein
LAAFQKSIVISLGINFGANSMNAKWLIAGAAVVVILAGTAYALTFEQAVTKDSLKDFGKQFSISAAKEKNGLVEFTIKHEVERPAYHVAHLEVVHQGKLVATSDTPVFGRKHDNTFHFALLPEDIAESKFSLSDSALGTGPEGSEPEPVPGTAIRNFKLADFVPKEMADEKK